MTDVRLPHLLRPQPSSHLVRLGRSNDGGYLVDKRDVAAADSLITFGLFDDWSFERAVLAGRDLPLHSYDATLTPAFLRKRFVWKLLNPHKVRRVLAGITNLFDYPRFFSGKRQHFAKFVGLRTQGEFVAIGAVFERAAAAGMARPFLKIDIEGGEYDLLDTLITKADQTAGLAIEFHECDTHIKAITDFVAAYPLTLVHIHGNNYKPVSASGIPETMELTFSSSPGDGAEVRLPHPLDMPCHRARPEVRLAFVPM